MPGLIDITPAVEVIDVRGHKVHVHGLESVSQFGSLLVRFPKLQEMAGERKLDAGALLQLSDDLVAAIIAMACRDENADPVFDERNASRLSMSEKAEIIGRAWRLTAPKGLGPFIDMLEAFGLAAPVGGAAASDSRSHSQSTISNATATRKRNDILRASSQPGSNSAKSTDAASSQPNLS